MSIEKLNEFCEHCKGLGYVIVGEDKETDDCPECKGTGKDKTDCR